MLRSLEGNRCTGHASQTVVYATCGLKALIQRDEHPCLWSTRTVAPLPALCIVSFMMLLRIVKIEGIENRLQQKDI